MGGKVGGSSPPAATKFGARALALAPIGLPFRRLIIRPIVIFV